MYLEFVRYYVQDCCLVVLFIILDSGWLWSALYGADSAVRFCNGGFGLWAEHCTEQICLELGLNLSHLFRNKKLNPLHCSSMVWGAQQHLQIPKLYFYYRVEFFILALKKGGKHRYRWTCDHVVICVESCSSHQRVRGTYFEFHIDDPNYLIIKIKNEWASRESAQFDIVDDRWW